MSRPARTLRVAFVAAWLAGASCVLSADAHAGAQVQASPPAGPAASAAASPMRTLPLKRDEATALATGASAGWAAGAVVLVLVLVGAVSVVALRRRGRGQPWRAAGGAGVLRRVSSQALTPQASVHVVRWGGDELLLACSAQQVRVIARRPALPTGREDA